MYSGIPQSYLSQYSNSLPVQYPLLVSELRYQVHLWLDALVPWIRRGHRAKSRSRSSFPTGSNISHSFSLPLHQALEAQKCISPLSSPSLPWENCQPRNAKNISDELVSSKPSYRSLVFSLGQKPKTDDLALSVVGWRLGTGFSFSSKALGWNHNCELSCW